MTEDLQVEDTKEILNYTLVEINIIKKVAIRHNNKDLIKIHDKAIRKIVNLMDLLDEL